MSPDMRDLLREQALGHHMALSGNQIEQFVSYLALVRKWQKTVVRLVGSDEATELVGKHVSDAFCIYKCIEEWKGRRLIDIGSGAGFPGVCLKLIEPSLVVTLLEASAKKAAFLAKVRAELGLSEMDIVRGRAEHVGHDDGFRERFDLTTIRGVAGLRRAIEIGLPFVRAGGHLVLARGESSDAEVATAECVAHRLGGGEVVVHSDCVEGVRVRGSIMVLAKVRATGTGFSRGEK